MSTSSIAYPTYSIHSSDRAIVVTFYPCSDPVRATEMNDRIHDQLHANPDADVIVDLERLGSPDNSVLRAVWQLTRKMQTRSRMLKCILSDKVSAPSLELFARNEVIEVFSSMKAAMGFEAEEKFDSLSDTVSWMVLE